MKNKWVEREFNFESTNYDSFIERLSITPSKIRSLISKTPDRVLITKNMNEWSIQENVGHLITVDKLFIKRLDDYQLGTDSLRPADVTGARTDKVNYNLKNIQNILEEFGEKRTKYVTKLKNLDDHLYYKSAWHPRLKQQMRLCDMLNFQAEHDLHHINKIKCLLDILSPNF